MGYIYKLERDRRGLRLYRAADPDALEKQIEDLTWEVEWIR
jgi:hypothetical protein